MWTTDKDTSNTLNADDLHALMASKLAVKRDSKTRVVRSANGESLVTSGAATIDAECKGMYKQLSKCRKMIFDKHRKETHDD